MASKGITGEKIEKVLMMGATVVLAAYAAPIIGALGGALQTVGGAFGTVGSTISDQD